MHIDFRYKTSDPVSSGDFKWEIKEGLDLPGDTVCYIDDISILHTCYTVEYYSSIMYIEMSNPGLTLSYSLITVSGGYITASSLVSAIGSLLQTRFLDYGISCICSNNVGTFGNILMTLASEY